MINNDDSTHPDGKRRSRVQYRIDQLHRGIPDEDLPWTTPHGSGQANAGAGVGSVNIPPNGARVMVHYEEDDPHVSYYTSSPTQDDVHGDNELVNHPSYPHAYGGTDAAGNLTVVDTKENTITQTHVSGGTQHTDAGGNLTLFFPGNITLGAGGDIVLAADGRIISHAGGDHSIKGAKVRINGSDERVRPQPVAARKRPQIRDRRGRVTA